METNKQQVQSTIKNFKLPSFSQLPSMGLFLEQTVKYINSALAPLELFQITPAMISNYVKMNIISSTTGKTYNREQIAYLIYITIFKNVISLNEITAMFELQKQEYSIEVAYDYLVMELDNALQYVFENKKSLSYVGGPLTEPKKLLKNAILSLAYKIYVVKYL